MLNSHTSSFFRLATMVGFSLAALSCASSRTTTPGDIPKDDRKNPGASFDQVMGILKSNPYDPAHLPVSFTSIEDIRSEQLLRDSGRTLDSSVDIRAPFRRLLHPNGVCLAGEWIIEKPNPSSGLFKAGSRFPIIARVSPPNDTVITRKAHPQSVGLVGKVFPSDDRQAQVMTANFFTQTDLGGYVSSKSTILDSSVTMSNAPGVTAVNRGTGLAAFGLQGNVLNQVDLKTTQRQLYLLAEAHKSGEPTRTPQFMRLTLNPSLDVADDGKGKDMRWELWDHLSHQGPLVYDITLSDDGEVVGPIFLQRSIVHWDKVPVGKIVFREAVLSAACDNQIHFQHAAWRDDVNDPGSTIRRQHGVAFGQPLIQDQVILQGEVVSRQNINAVFKDLDDIKRWSAWSYNPLVKSVKETPREHFYDVTFTVGDDVIHSTCKHEAEANSVISLSCRGTDDALAFQKSPVEHELTFLLSELPDGNTKIDWGLLIRSRKVMEARQEVETKLQKTIEERFRGR
ncbi:hypothetical protein GPROT1_01539 [Gammaproteobacteria bacterium]|nr:hypothetical protein GPROT1_01539 [Gammaproteobacteria bacterium]